MEKQTDKNYFNIIGGIMSKLTKQEVLDLEKFFKICYNNGKKESQKGMIKIEDVNKMIFNKFYEKMIYFTKPETELNRALVFFIIEFEKELKQSLKELGDK
jgi:hypothetical protein